MNQSECLWAKKSTLSHSTTVLRQMSEWANYTAKLQPTKTVNKKRVQSYKQCVQKATIHPYIEVKRITSFTLGLLSVRNSIVLMPCLWKWPVPEHHSKMLVVRNNLSSNFLVFCMITNPLLELLVFDWLLFDESTLVLEIDSKTHHRLNGKTDIKLLRHWAKFSGGLKLLHGLRLMFWEALGFFRNSMLIGLVGTNRGFLIAFAFGCI